MFISYKELSAYVLSALNGTGRGIGTERDCLRIPTERPFFRWTALLRCIDKGDSTVGITATNQAGRIRRIGISAPIIHPSSFFIVFFDISRSEDIIPEF